MQQVETIEKQTSKASAKSKNRPGAHSSIWCTGQGSTLLAKASTHTQRDRSLLVEQALLSFQSVAMQPVSLSVKYNHLQVEFSAESVAS